MWQTLKEQGVVFAQANTAKFELEESSSVR
jgi:hypothetical protein